MALALDRSFHNLSKLETNQSDRDGCFWLPLLDSKDLTHIFEGTLQGCQVGLL